MIAIGDKAPSFTLPDTNGGDVAFPDGRPTVVVFTCNHCPYALAWHDRLLAVASDYSDVQTVLINPNDSERYPRDSFDAMRERLEREGPWPAPYVHDESQEVARAYGAKTTPDVFVFDADGILRYRGAPDADHMDDALNAAWLRAALDAVLAGRDVTEPETTPVGCSVKWKP
ncbi:MAG TPA: thioredoxin family protein [Thermoleophilaceae bacterium]